MHGTKGKIRPNLEDYERYCRRFTWSEAERELSGLPFGRGLNIAHEAVDRHLENGRSDQTAFRFLRKDGAVEDLSYKELSKRTNKFANVLQELGIGRGDRVFALTGRIPELYLTALGTLKHRSVFCPLFSAFGPEPIRMRAEIGEAKVIVTTESLYRKKVAKIVHDLPSVRAVLLVNENGEKTDIPGTIDLRDALDAAASGYEIGQTDPEDPALLHFTSGTTGRPKGAVHVHKAVVAHHITGKLVLDLHSEDIFWCTADPGWVTGTSYGIISPLTNGVTSIVDEAEFDAERWYRTLQNEEVSVWYSAPTAIRMLMKAGDDVVGNFDLSKLRLLASVGEPLNPEAVIWSEKVFGIPFRDNWWQTETGGIMIANFASMIVKPGSMGRPVPGIEAAIVREAPEGGIEEVVEPGEQGELALRPDFPSIFRAYLNEHERYAKCFADGFYLTGDLATKDEDGYFWFVGRKDDVIKTAGHLIGPFEVESVLMEHPAVAEAGVIGKPDPVAMEIVKAFVSLKTGFEADESLRRDLLGHARKRLGPAVAPKEIEFTPSLPKTRSGKIMRRLLKARELGLPEGDISTLEK
ncbi:MAG: acetate--CoA ligase [Acidobacteriota bacterium]|nr:MAG: acetate--CoA ligase [Acidobacteriota bacterium]